MIKVTCEYPEVRCRKYNRARTLNAGFSPHGTMVEQRLHGHALMVISLFHDNHGVHFSLKSPVYILSTEDSVD